MPLADGGALKLTTSRYFTPSGASIQGTGIVPDIAGPPESAGRTGGPESASLAVRDADVHLGLATLKTRGALAQRTDRALMARELVP